MSILPSSAAVQDLLRGLREKEEQDLAAAALLKQQKLQELQTTVESAKKTWEAEMLFEIEKRPEFIKWVRNRFQASPHNKWIQSQTQCNTVNVVRLSRDPTIYEIAEHVIAGSTYPEEYTLENERMRMRSRVVSQLIDSVKKSLSAEALAERQRLAEEAARKRAEEQAKIAEGKEKQRMAFDAYAKDLLATIKTPYHSFTGVEPTGRVMFVSYAENTKQLQLSLWSIDYHVGDSKATMARKSMGCPEWMKAPTAWNKMYEEGRLPFLTCCPVCSDQIRFQFRRIDEWGHHGPEIWDVACVSGHYRWDPATNLHYRNLNPSMHTTARGLLWDPRDPDGSIAAKAALEAKIAAKEAEIAKLQADLAALRRPPSLSYSASLSYP